MINRPEPYHEKHSHIMLVSFEFRVWRLSGNPLFGPKRSKSAFHLVLNHFLKPVGVAFNFSACHFVINWVFAFLAMLWPCFGIVVSCCLPYISGTVFPVNTIDVILAEQTLLSLSLWNQLFSQSLLFIWIMSGETHYNQHVQHWQASSLNKGHMFDTSSVFFHRMNALTD